MAYQISLTSQAPSIDENIMGDTTKQCNKRQCNACDFQRLKGMENNPIVRELQDKIERLHFKLLECRNQNQLLKRDLLMAKKVMSQEIGGKSIDFQNLLKHGTEIGWKGRQEKVLLLKNKVKELQDRIQDIEGDGKVVQEAPAETKQVPNERKLYWRLELERRQVHERAEKDMSYLIDETNDLRSKMDNMKARNRELTQEVTMLRAELHSMTEKNREDNSIIQALHNVENQLKDTLEDKSEIRRELDGARARNKRLTDETILLKEQVTALVNRTNQDNNIIDALNMQHKYLEDLINREKMIGKRNYDRYADEVKKLQSNHTVNTNLLDHLQEFINQKNCMIESIKENVPTDFMGFLNEAQAALEARLRALQPEEPEKKEEEEEESVKEVEPEKEPVKTGKGAKGGKSDKEPGKEKAGKEPGKEKTGKGGKSKEKEKEPEVEEPVEPPELPEPTEEETQIMYLKMEIAKYKTLFEAAEEESQRLSRIIVKQNYRLNEMTLQIVETKRLCMQRDAEKKELEESIKASKESAAEKKRKKKPYETEKELPLPVLDPLEELKIQIENLTEENEFLRNFLRANLPERIEDFRLYESIVMETRKLFIATLSDIIVLLGPKMPPIVEQPDEAESVVEKTEEEQT